MAKPGTIGPLGLQVSSAHKGDGTESTFADPQSTLFQVGQEEWGFVKLMFILINVHMLMQSLFPFLILIVYLKPLAHVLERW